MELYEAHHGTSNQLYRKFNYIQAERKWNANSIYMKCIKRIGKISNTFSSFRVFIFERLCDLYFDFLRTYITI